jgi:hypothetical protein
MDVKVQTPYQNLFQQKTVFARSIDDEVPHG